MKRILFATTNEGKLKEARMILGDLDCVLVSVGELGLTPQAEETGTTFAENALIKARELHELTGETVLADDSGLEVDYLNKQPGVQSARFLGYDTPYSIKNQYILEQLAGVPEEARTARFVCVIACVLANGEAFTEYATIEGRIGDHIAGENGFGYDPIFYLPDYGKTTAELSPEEKNQISHRGKALRAIREQLRERHF